MDRITDKFSKWAACCYTPGARTEADLEIEMQPLDSTPAGSHLYHLQHIVEAHLPRDRSLTEYAVLFGKYGSRWPTQETMRQWLHCGPEFMAQSRLPADTFICPGKLPLPDDLQAGYEELLQAFIRAGLDYCALKFIPLGTAYSRLIAMQVELHELPRTAAEAPYADAFHRLACLYLKGLTDAQVQHRNLVGALYALRKSGASLQGFCPADIPPMALLNLPDLLHAIAHGAASWLFEGHAAQVYQGRKGEGGFHEPEGLLRPHELRHPGSTAAACAAIALIARMLCAPWDTQITLQWLDTIRDTLAAHMELAPEHRLGGKSGTGALGGAVQVRVNCELTAFKDAMGARQLPDDRATYRAIAALCHGLLRYQAFGRDGELPTTVLLQYLLLHNGFPAVPQQPGGLLRGSIEEIAMRLEVFCSHQRAMVGQLTCNFFFKGPDEQA